MTWGSKRRHGKERRRQEHLHEIVMEDTIRTIDKSDPEFAAISGQCTPPKDIKVRHGMAPALMRSEDRDPRYVQRKGKEKTSLW